MGAALVAAAAKELKIEAASDMGKRLFGFSREEVDDDGTYYEGFFMFHQRNGKGVYHSPASGMRYEGTFQADVYHGDGDKTWQDGSRYVGQWRNGQKHGKGRLVSGDNLVYEGQWDGGRRHGIGSQTYANQERYRGGWFNGLCSGLGTYWFADGTRFEGTWADGRYDGTGILYGPDGSRERRVYNRGFLKSREKLTNGPAPQPGSRRDFTCKRVISDQLRSEMLKPTRRAMPVTSVHLIRRETAGLDLTAPPLKPKTAPAAVGRGLLEDFPEVFPPAPPATAPAALSFEPLDT